MRVIRATHLDSAFLSCSHSASLKTRTSSSRRSHDTFHYGVARLQPALIHQLCSGPMPKGDIRPRFARTLTTSNGAIPLSPAQKDTIYALSTPPGRAGIAVIRISGPRALDVYNNLVKTRGRAETVTDTTQNDTRPAGVSTPEPWKMHRCSIVDPSSKQVLDEGLAVYFAGRNFLCFPLELKLTLLFSTTIIHF